MFQVPESFLDKLRCSLCDGYVNARPVVVNEGKQICAKCYRILPNDEKAQCVREISFEAIGSCLVFPCRYHKMGCDHTFIWNNENGHESECKKRYFTFPDVVGTNKNEKHLDDDETVPINLFQEESVALLTFSAKYEKHASTSLINAETHTNLAFNKDVQDSIHLKSFQPYEEVHYVKSPGLYENIYSTIPSISMEIIRCLSCNVQVEKHNRNTCLFGHVSCNTCKGDMCIVCVKNLDGSSRIACKNAARGCKEILLQGDVGFHRDNCEFNEICCPVDKCAEKNVQEKIKAHLKGSHADKIISSNEVAKVMGQMDQTLVFLCYAGIFRCFYYYYGSLVEIIVVYLGPCAEASEFCFEVSAEVNKKALKRTLGCANWNNYMLASGVNFERKELLGVGDKRLSCVFTFRIIRSKEFKRSYES